MKFPSIAEAMTRAREAALRFPFVILSGASAALFACIAVGDSDPVWQRATFAALLGIPLFFGLALVRGRRPGRGLLPRAAGLLVPILFFFASAGWAERLLIFRFLHLAFALHLCVAIAPFIGRHVGRAFWQYNRILFLRFLVGALFTVVLFAGLALALAALDPLFDIRLDGDTYPRLFFLLALLFSPWFFAAGVPDDVAALEARTDYPGGLRVFAQFVLIPLVTVYLLLLTAYLARVLITRTWPSGWIGWLVSGVAVTGTLALLLVHPLREDEGNRWVDLYARWFYVALLPSIAMLLAAIGQRIGQYGVTEPRFHLLVLAVALAGIAVFQAITASRDIRVIPGTLAVVALLTYVGPQSAYAFTERSQRGRIAEVLRRNDMLEEGRARPAPADLSFEDRREISGALAYLLRTRGTESVRPLLVPPDAPADTAALRSWQVTARAIEILAPLGIAYTDARQIEGAIHFGIQVRDAPAAIHVTGWDWMVDGDLRRGFTAHTPTGDSLVARPIGPGTGLTFELLHGAERLAVVDLTDQVTRLMDARASAQWAPLPQDSLTFLVEGERADVLVRFQHISGRRYPAADTLDFAGARLLVRLK